MGFINKKLTETQREEFRKKNVINPLSPVLPALSPVYWTIDKDKNEYLFRIGTHRDFPDEEWFFYKWKEKEIIVFLKKKTVLPNTRIWHINIKEICDYNKLENKEVINSILDDLREALDIYQYNGKPNEENQEMNIICEF